MSTPLSQIERHCSVIPAPDQNADIFINAFGLWKPGARGIFGGIAIAQSLRAAQATVGGRFDVHSMHCSFVFPGQPDKPISYSVERIRDGRSFCTRFVRGSQSDRLIFMATLSFAVTTVPFECLQHADPLPSQIPLKMTTTKIPVETYNIPPDSPYMNKSVGIRNLPSGGPQGKRIHHWLKARGKLSSDDPSIHLAALALMSDSYFLAAVPHTHDVWDFDSPPVTEFYSTNHDIFATSSTHTKIPRPHYDSQVKSDQIRKKVSVMVSLDHTIYFHNQRKSRADEWLLAEVQTNWAGNGRGLIHQKIWSKSGILLATCVQEGIIRLENTTNGNHLMKTHL